MQLPQRKGRPVRDSSLGEDVVKMDLDGPFVEVELSANFLVLKGQGKSNLRFPVHVASKPDRFGARE